MGSAACPSTPHPLKIPSFKFGCWRTRRKPGRSPANYILLPTLVATLYGNSSVTDIPIKQVTASVWRPPRAAHSASWALNAMPHEPHGSSASMVTTGREPALPPDLISDTSPSHASEDTPGYVETIQQRLQLAHQQMIAPPTAPSSNPYHEGSLVYVLTTPPERTSKLAPRWKGPFRVCRIPNEYQVTYEDDGLERTVHVNHAKPAKFTAPDLPEPVPPTEAPRPPLGYLPAGLARKSTKPHVPPVTPSEAPMAPPAAPAVPMAISSPAAPANQCPEPAPPCRRSPRLQPEPGQAHAILGHPSTPQPQFQPRPHAANSPKMARIYPLTIGYTEALGPKANPFSFSSL